MPVYEPHEDSELLRRFVEREARGAVLDMGTGTGVLALAAAQKDEVTSVLAVDNDDDALTWLRQTLQKRGADGKRPITIVKSDLFTALGDQRFDTIICNPPYLPDEEHDAHPALYGGPGGWEFIARFLDGAKSHLEKDGSILLLFSSLSNRERVIQHMKERAYRFEELAVEYHFFEQLYVYRLWRHGDD